MAVFSLGSAVLFLSCVGLRESFFEDSRFRADVAGAFLGTELPGGPVSFFRCPCPTRASGEGASSCCLTWWSVPCPALSCRYAK